MKNERNSRINSKRSQTAQRATIKHQEIMNSPVMAANTEHPLHGINGWYLTQTELNSNRKWRRLIRQHCSQNGAHQRSTPWSTRLRPRSGRVCRAGAAHPWPATQGWNPYSSDNLHSIQSQMPRTLLQKRPLNDLETGIYLTQARDGE